ncbi:hypothetical protein QBC36DRAFT_180902 [Triangularia setosa]|uniref:Uncharacterized protein n=1 Tax=Triangularia setosa TaxID=2587417 RepID=A0AAN6WBW6_9PEZI|nr:hypothetical protein QBC36DRAFT_180902 [Podospora setosa]
MAKTKRKAVADVGVGGDAKRMRTIAAPAPATSGLVSPIPDHVSSDLAPPRSPSTSPSAKDPEHTFGLAVENGALPAADASGSAPGKLLSAFDRLPGEVRNMIYGYGLRADRSIIPRVPGLPNNGTRSPRHDIPADTVLGLALGFNKNISREVLTYFYGENKFALSAPYHKAWVNRIGKRNAACIRALTIHCEAKDKQAQNYLTEMQNALGKRCRSLKVIEYNCEWLLLEHQAFFQRITAKHMANSWKHFKHLETINLQHYDLPGHIKNNSPAWELLVKLCKQSKVKVSATGRLNMFLKDRVAVEWNNGEVVKAWHSEEERRD